MMLSSNRNVKSSFLKDLMWLWNMYCCNLQVFSICAVQYWISICYATMQTVSVKELLILHFASQQNIKRACA